MFSAFDCRQSIHCIEIAHLLGSICSQPIIDAHFSSRGRPLSALYRSLSFFFFSLSLFLPFAFCRGSKETFNRSFISLPDSILFHFIVEVLFSSPFPLFPSLWNFIPRAACQIKRDRSMISRDYLSSRSICIFTSYRSLFYLAAASYD